MTSQPLDEEAIFHAARAMESLEDRADYLGQACGDNAALRARVDGLLKVLAEEKSFAGSPAAILDMIEHPPISERPGTVIGPYKLMEQIGEGGFGLVFVAEQQHPVRRKVALKVIKPGMDTRDVIARFEAERQALALMDHPNIAKVFDAGATESGRPYFVMELVRGIPITEYCDEQHLTTRERLELVVSICHAIQHAHQKGIIHRDVKPTNVLVTEHDGRPVVKVIDFGVAKALSQQLTERTVYTQFAQMIGTPLYMSPEQAAMNGLDIDTRSDIYSLGVLLYELLTGTTPFDPERLRKVGADEMRRIIREEEPPKPSTRVTTLNCEILSTVAGCRTIESSKLGHSLRGDLDWIVMKCLEKDRTRRYETASALAIDIQRYLNDEAITARPPTNLYRLQKLVRRNKFAVVAASAILAALIVGLGISTWMFIKEKAARQRAVAAEREQTRLRRQAETNEQLANTAAAKSAQVAALMQEMLQGVGPSVALGRDTKMLREILDRAMERVGKDLKQQPELEAELLTTLGRVYHDLGEYSKAEAMHRRALMIREDQFGNEHPKVAESLNELGLVIRSVGRPAEAESIHRQTLAMRRKLFGDEHPEVAASLNNLAEALQYQNKFPEAEVNFREALVIRSKLFGNENADVARSLQNLASVLQVEGRLDEIEAMQREALKIRKNVFGDEHPEVAHSLQSVASALLVLGKASEAEVFARDALAMRRKIFGSEHPEVGGTNGSLGYLAATLLSQRKLADAELVLREQLAIRKKLYGNEHANVCEPLMSLADVLRQEGKLPEAESLFREAFALQRKLWGENCASAADACYSLALVLCEEGKGKEAERLFNEVLTPEFENQPQSAGWLRFRGDLHARAGRWHKAATDFSKVIGFEPDDHIDYHMLAPLLVHNRDLEEYRRLRALIVGRFEKTTDPVVAERMVKDCLILPASDAELNEISRMADTVAGAAPNHWATTFFQFAKGLSEFRQGHFESAVGRMNEVLEKSGEFDFRDAQAYMILAMSAHHLNRANQARVALAKGNEIAKARLQQLESRDTGDYWWDWIIVQALEREATNLIDGKSTTTPHPQH